MIFADFGFFPFFGFPIFPEDSSDGAEEAWFWSDWCHFGFPVTILRAVTLLLPRRNKPIFPCSSTG